MGSLVELTSSIQAKDVVTFLKYPAARDMIGFIGLDKTQASIVGELTSGPKAPIDIKGNCPRYYTEEKKLRLLGLLGKFPGRGGELYIRAEGLMQWMEVAIAREKSEVTKKDREKIWIEDKIQQMHDCLEEFKQSFTRVKVDETRSLELRWLVSTEEVHLWVAEIASHSSSLVIQPVLTWEWLGRYKGTAYLPFPGSDVWWQARNQFLDKGGQIVYIIDVDDFIENFLATETPAAREADITAMEKTLSEIKQGKRLDFIDIKAVRKYTDAKRAVRRGQLLDTQAMVVPETSMVFARDTGECVLSVNDSPTQINRALYIRNGMSLAGSMAATVDSVTSDKANGDGPIGRLQGMIERARLRWPGNGQKKD